MEHKSNSYENSSETILAMARDDSRGYCRSKTGSGGGRVLPFQKLADIAAEALGL
jgi:hypothetical protein